MTVTVIKGQTQKVVSVENGAGVDNADLYVIAKNFTRETDSSLFGHRISRTGPNATVILFTD